MGGETTEPESTKPSWTPEPAYGFFLLEADLVTHSQATGHSFPWKLYLPGTGEETLA